MRVWLMDRQLRYAVLRPKAAHTWFSEAVAPTESVVTLRRANRDPLLIRRQIQANTKGNTCTKRSTWAAMSSILSGDGISRA